MLLFVAVPEEAVYNFCGETNAHDRLHYSRYFKLCSTSWILQNKLLALASLVQLLLWNNRESSFWKGLLYSNVFH